MIIIIIIMMTDGVFPEILIWNLEVWILLVRIFSSNSILFFVLSEKASHLFHFSQLNFVVVVVSLQADGRVVILAVSVILAECMMVLSTVAATKTIILVVWDGMINKATSFLPSSKVLY